MLVPPARTLPLLLLLPTHAGVFSLLAATEITDGVFYPVGGFGKVRRSRLTERSTPQHGTGV